MGSGLAGLATFGFCAVALSVSTFCEMFSVTYEDVISFERAAVDTSKPPPLF
jgi:hypothetical protein